MTGITNRDNAGVTLSYYNYQYDDAMRAATHTYWSQVGTVAYSGTKTYAYDTTSQVTGDTGAPYSYDDNGNRTMAGYQTGAANRMTGDGVYTYTHDAEGNVSSKSKGAGLETWYYAWDNRNRLVNVRATSDGTTTTLSVTYTYDALDGRVQEDRWKSGVGTVTTRFVNDGDQALADLDGSNVVQVQYVYGEGTDEVLGRVVASGGVYATLTDSLGSVRDELSFSGAVVDHVDYDAFGQAAESHPASGGRFLFAGGDADRDTGMARFGARYYIVSAGRWASEDPIMFRAGDANLYRYVGNGPTNGVDPSGLDEALTPADRKEIFDTATEFILQVPRFLTLKKDIEADLSKRSGVRQVIRFKIYTDKDGFEGHWSYDPTGKDTHIGISTTHSGFATGSLAGSKRVGMVASTLFFELMNAKQEKRFQDLSNQAAKGNVSRLDYVVGMELIEYQNKKLILDYIALAEADEKKGGRFNTMYFPAMKRDAKITFEQVLENARNDSKYGKKHLLYYARGWNELYAKAWHDKKENIPKTAGYSDHNIARAEATTKYYLSRDAQTKLAKFLEANDPLWAELKKLKTRKWPGK